MDTSSSVHNQKCSFINFNSTSNVKKYGFVLTLIVGVGALTAGAIGVAGFFGALRNMTQVDAIVTMAVGGGSGILLVSICIASVVNHREEPQPQKKVGVHSAPPQETALSQIDTREGTFYGPNSWSVWGVEVLDKDIPKPPKIPENKAVFYLPERIQVKGQQKDFTLNVLKEITDLLVFGTEDIEKEFGNIKVKGRYVIIDKAMREETFDRSYEEQRKFVRNRMPLLPEAAAFQALVYGCSSKKQFSERDKYIRCDDVSSSGEPITIQCLQKMWIEKNRHDSRSVGTYDVEI